MPWPGYGVVIARHGSALICLYVIMDIDVNIMMIILIYNITYNKR